MESKNSSSIILVLFFAILLVVASVSLVLHDYSPRETKPTPEPEHTAYPNVTDAPVETEQQVPEYSFKFSDAPEGYFEDALFIGDSRTVGLQEYGGIDEAKYFATVGLGVSFASYSSADVDGIGNITLTSLLQNFQFGKIYIMLGINEIGGSLDSLAVVYKELLVKIRSYQPDAVIYILSNLHVGAEYDQSGSAVNNTNLNTFNELISHFADNENIFYLDENMVFDNENGTLSEEKTFDGLHLTAEAYVEFARWLSLNAIIKL